MSKLVPSKVDNVQQTAERAQAYMMILSREVFGPNAAKFLSDYHEATERVLHELSRRFTAVLTDDEAGLTQIAGRIKYLTGDLKILKTCAELAAIMDGRCRTIALECMANLEAQRFVLTIMLMEIEPFLQAA